MNRNTYYRPLNSNFESVDAVVYPQILLQFFRSRRGTHGYKVKGLKVLHEHLKQDHYLLCSCVPVDQYDNTGFQNWLNVDKTKPKAEPDTVVKLFHQYVVQVDYSQFSS